MISLGGLVNQKAFGKFEMGKVISNPFANAFIKEGEDHEVSMGQNQLDTIIKMATELKAKMGENEKEIPAWIQDHISKAENYISQAAGNYHEYGTNESINEIEYKDALEKFNLDLYKNSQVAAIAKHHNRPVKDVVKKLQPYIKVLRYNDKSIKLISIDYRETNSNVKVHVSQTYKQNESVNEGKFYAFFNNKKHEIEAKDLWDAKQKAITMLKVPKSKVGYLAIVNAKEHDGGSYRFESVNESIVNEAGAVPMYNAYLALSNKVRGLEDAQKAMAKQYFAEKELKKKASLLQQLKKGTEELKKWRARMTKVETDYVMNLDRDAEYAG